MIERIDHLVLTVKDINKTISFYRNVLGMREVTFGQNRKALVFGNQKINIHQAGSEIEPHAAFPLPGSLDLCFISLKPLEEVIEILAEHEIEIIKGPVSRTGASGPIESLYLRDPDGNLIEISEYRT